MMHRHHLIPQHAGGTDEESNLTPPISTRLHAMFHYDRWKHLGDSQDYIAYRCLLGRMSSETARLLAARIGQEKSDAYKLRYFSGPKVTNTEACSRGGKKASVALIQWQREHREEFLLQSSINGKLARDTSWSPERKAKGGIGGSGRGHTPEARERIRQAVLRRWYGDGK
jgi:hypothetical protein